MLKRKTRSAHCGAQGEKDGIASRGRGVVFRAFLGWAGVFVAEKGIIGVILPKKSRKAAEREAARAERGARRQGKGGFPASPILAEAARLLRRYFAGERVSFDLPLDIRYSTTFQRAVWRAAAEIPFGETRSYGWIAKRIKKPKAARAVGRALGANPFPIIVPCHRVISSTGALGGFSGGTGLKKKLLELEANAHVRL